MKLEPAMEDWLLSSTAWWLAELGLPDEPLLVMPTVEYFPGQEPEELLEATFVYAEMTEDDGWRFELVDESDGVAIPDPLANMVRPLSAMASREREDEGTVSTNGPLPIPYTREDLKDPALFIRLLACAASHYLLHTARDELPGGESAREAIVELGAAMLGFGVILANSASRFEGHQDGLMIGWSSAQLGHLGEDALGYAVALFVELTGIGEKEARRHLGANPKAAFKWALKQLRGPRRAEAERLRSIAPRQRDGEPYR
jgi:hypothetical protein